MISASVPISQTENKFATSPNLTFFLGYVVHIKVTYAEFVNHHLQNFGKQCYITSSRA